MWEDRLEAEIDGGLLVLIGIAAADSTREADYLIEKLVNLRIFADRDGKMNHSALDLNAQLLLISQFTLYGDCRKGHGPSFNAAAPPAVAGQLFTSMLWRRRRPEG